MPYRGLAWAGLLGAAFVSARCAGSTTQIVFAADRRPALDGEMPSLGSTTARGFPDGSRLVLFAAKVNTGSLGSLVFDVHSVRRDGTGVQRPTTNVSGWAR